MPDINVNKLSEALNTKADIDLNNTGVFSTSGGLVNLTSSTPVNASGKEVTSADFIKSDIQSNLLNYTTNRILEIPQDIKLELNNGTLTLKAGSKVYVPNGFEADGTTPKFDVVTIESDVTYSAVYTSTVKCYAIYDYSAKKLQIISLTDSRLSYNSTTNKVIHTALSDTVLSFPFALVVRDTTGIGSIEQVFNGFGYIGSTIFSLPDIKVQGAFGVNEDGTYRLKTFETDNILTASFGSDINGRYTFGFDIVENGTYTYFGAYANEPKVSETQPSGTNFAWWNPIKGETIYVNNSGIVDSKPHIPSRLGWINISGGKIASMTRNPTDSIVTSNALNFSQSGRSYLSGLGMPSDRYIDLTLGASGSTYTAPANGWFHLQKVSGVANALINLYNQRVGHSSFGISIASGNDTSMNLNAYLPVKKGDSMYISYSATGETKYFTFNYAEGDK